MSPEEIENGFASAGWHLDGGFEDYLLIGYSDHGLSILAPKKRGGKPTTTIPSSSSSIARGTSPTGFGRYRLLRAGPRDAPRERPAARGVGRRTGLGAFAYTTPKSGEISYCRLGRARP